MILLPPQLIARISVIEDNLRQASRLPCEHQREQFWDEMRRRLNEHALGRVEQLWPTKHTTVCLECSRLMDRLNGR